MDLSQNFWKISEIFMAYSIAIRTLGTSGEKLIKELTSITTQTVPPEKVIVYIAEGYNRPTFQIGKEEYIWVKKGMVSQRALQYREIDSEYILLLDDDVELLPWSVEKMLAVLEENDADVVGADCFKNQEMSVKSKFFATITNWVVPHTDNNWAFKIYSHCSFSYLNKPEKKSYPSQSSCGPASLWRKEAFLALHIEDETFLDKLGFPYGEDLLMFNKVFQNGYNLRVHYDCGIEHLDGKSSSAAYHNNVQKFYVRAKGSFILWWRTCYQTRPCKIYVAFIYCVKIFWLFFVNVASAIALRNIKIPYLYLMAIWDAWHFVHSEEYKQIPLFNSYQR